MEVVWEVATLLKNASTGCPKGKPINIFNKAEHNEGQCLPDDDGSSDDFDDIRSQHTHTF